MYIQMATEGRAAHKCQSTFRNLLQARGVAAEQNPAVFIRELLETSRCDSSYDLGDVRRAYQAMVGTDSMDRIASFKETDADDKRARQAVVHHFDWTEQRLLKALDWSSTVWYYTEYTLDRTVSFVTRDGGVVGGWRFVRPRGKDWQQQQQPPQPQQQQQQ